MNSKYAMLGFDTASRRFERGRGGAAHSELWRALGNLQAGAERVNLGADSIHLAAEIAALEPGLDEPSHLALIVLILISLAALEEGSTRFPVTGEASREPMGRMLGALCADGFDDAARERIGTTIADLMRPGRCTFVIGHSPDARKPLLYLKPFLYHQRIHDAENRLAEHLARLCTQPARAIPEAAALGAALDDVVARPSFLDGIAISLSAEQRLAVETAVGSRLAVISGGPGTGKTSIVVSILRVLARVGCAPQEVALAAPTGKAAYRMRDSIAMGVAQIAKPSKEDKALGEASLDPATIHRLLGYSPERGTFRHHARNPLAARAVIVDEGSMLDLVLMEHLAGALADDARLVILGDANQLPSVAAGAVFRDLLPASGGHAGKKLARGSVELRHNYRMDAADDSGAAILETANRINEGASDLFVGSASSVRMRRSAAELEFGGVEFLLNPAASLGPFLDRWDEEMIGTHGELGRLVADDFRLVKGEFTKADSSRLSRLFTLLSSARILCVTRVGSAGAEMLNERMHRRAISRTGGGRAPMIAGEPVIVLRNDYEHSLFNGDQGALVNVREGGAGRSLAAIFPRDGRFMPFRIEMLRERLALCYAMTVHKAQGSEFARVALVLPDRDIPLLSREVLYTGVSRSRHSVVIVGDPKLAAHGVERKIDRFSGLSEALNLRLAR
jgi:exodeoxyribonuclease V alpha subunit